RRRADVERARAQYEEEVAAYRQTVLTALREVEDNLAQLRLLTRQREAQQTALDNADQAARLSHVQYREGAISYLDVIEADRSTLTQRRAALRLNGEQARATVLLVRALGGGWELPTP
ncbi:TolC family protein, partial [Bordetella trematum]